MSIDLVDYDDHGAEMRFAALDLRCDYPART